MYDTEKINERSIGISKMPADKISELIIKESYNSFEASKKAGKELCKIIPELLNRIKKGGRIIYIGAGTSGRIAAQDVIELYPTYGLDNNYFDYIMCGGIKALHKSIEGSEDNIKQAIIDMKRKKFGDNDVLVGISASGQTPYVINAIKYANSLNAVTVGITNNKNTEISKISKYNIILNTGPEVVQGSTRMNAGTSQKIILNALSTTIAILMGRTYDNTMGYMKSNFNKKLNLRAVNILMSQFKLSNMEAVSLLEKYNYDIDSCIKEISNRKKL